MKPDEIPITMIGGLIHKANPIFQNDLVLACVGFEKNGAFFGFNKKNDF